MINPLPHWVLTDKHYAFYDSESATAIEQTAKLYAAMQSLIEAFNQLDTEMHGILDEFNQKLHDGTFIEIMKEEVHFAEEIRRIEDRIKQLLTYFENADFFSVSEANENFGLLTKDGYFQEPESAEIIPEYFESARIAFDGKLDELTGDTTIAFMTDNHYHPDSSYWNGYGNARTGLNHPNLLTPYENYFDCVVFGGDNADTDSNPNKDYILGVQKNIATTMHLCTDKPTFILKGNHDDNSIFYKDLTDYSPYNKSGFDGVITDSEFDNIYRYSENLYNEVRRNNSSPYFYYDIPNKNVRVVGIDTYDCPETVTDGVIDYPRNDNAMISIEQLRWLSDEALQVPNTRHVIIFTHCPLAGTTSDTPAKNTVNHGEFLQLLQAFKTGGSGSITVTSDEACSKVDYNFEDAGNIIAVVSGHLHKDVFNEVNGIYYLSMRGTLGAETVADPISYHFFTPEEASFSFFNVDTESKTLKVIGFGRGSDLNINY